MLQQKPICLLVQISATRFVCFEDCSEGLNQLCLQGHCNFLLIFQSAFNCFAKNALKLLNAPKPETFRAMV